MSDKTFRVAIIGAGVCGAAIARTLSAYNLDVVLLEKHIDAGFGVSKANSGIIHSGFHHKPGSLKARLEIQGNKMFDQLHEDLGFPFKRVGILVVAFSNTEMKTIEHLYEQGISNNVPDLEICSAERVRYLEPKINEDAIGALYAPNGGIVESYHLVYSLAESAQKNGVKLVTDFEVAKADKKSDNYIIHSKKGDKIKAEYVINAAGLYADKVSDVFKAEHFKITPRKGEEYLLDRNSTAHPRHVLFPVPAKNSKGILVIPTVEGTTMIGPTAEEIEDKEDFATSKTNLEKVFSMAKHMVPVVSRRDIITAFTGLRPSMEGNDFFIDISKKAKNFIQVAGIQSPGLTASPAIAEYVKDLLEKAGLKLVKKNNFDPKIDKPVHTREKSPEEMAELVEKNKQYANIICRCENISEAEIVEAIRKGHTSIDGIKFYTRAGMGRCQGGFCLYKILKIIARETGKDILELSKRGPESYIVEKKLGEKQNA